MAFIVRVLWSWWTELINGELGQKHSSGVSGFCEADGLTCINGELGQKHFSGVSGFYEANGLTYINGELGQKHSSGFLFSVPMWQSKQIGLLLSGL